jgi:hypothetical protein
MERKYILNTKEINPADYHIITADLLKLYETCEGQPVYILPDGTKIKGCDDGYFQSEIYDPRLKINIFEGDFYYSVDEITLDDNGEISDIEMYGITESHE